MAFSPDGRLVLPAPTTTRRGCGTAASGTPIATLHGHTGSVSAVAFSPDGRLVLTGSARQDGAAVGGGSRHGRRHPAGHTDWVRAVAFSPDGRLLLTGSHDDTARLWEAASGTSVATLSRAHGPGQCGGVLARRRGWC